MTRGAWGMGRWACMALALGGASRLGAQENPREAQPERPTVATHAGIVAPRYLEIETGIERDGNPSSFLSSAPTVFKIGVARRVQLDLVAPVVQGQDNARLGDVALAAKIRLLDDAPVVGDFALQPSYKWPTGSLARGTGTGTHDASLLLISSHAFGDISMDVNAGLTRRSDVPRTSTLWTASFGGPVVQGLGWTCEVYGYPGTGAQAPIVALLAGPTYKAATTLVFDAGIIAPIAGPQPHALYAGLTYNVGRIW